MSDTDVQFALGRSPSGAVVVTEVRLSNPNGLRRIDLDAVNVDALIAAHLRKLDPVATVRPLGRPDKSGDGEFYANVCRAYLDEVALGSSAGAVLATEAGVPMTTVHRWVREGRLRGFLPPARRGRPSNRGVNR